MFVPQSVHLFTILVWRPFNSKKTHWHTWHCPSLPCYIICLPLPNEVGREIHCFCAFRLDGLMDRCHNVCLRFLSWTSCCILIKLHMNSWYRAELCILSGILGLMIIAGVMDLWWYGTHKPKGESETGTQNHWLGTQNHSLDVYETSHE